MVTKCLLILYQLTEMSEGQGMQGREAMKAVTPRFPLYLVLKLLSGLCSPVHIRPVLWSMQHSHAFPSHSAPPGWVSSHDFQLLLEEI